MNSKEIVIEVIRKMEKPTINDLIQADDENFSAVRFLIKILTGFTTETTGDSPNQTLKIGMSSGATLIEIDKTQSGHIKVNGELAERLNKLLVAIRIHEIDSFEWVYLPPEMRTSFIAERANSCGASVQEIKQLMNVWTA